MLRAVPFCGPNLVQDLVPPAVRGRVPVRVGVFWIFAQKNSCFLGPQSYRQGVFLVQ